MQCRTCVATMYDHMQLGEVSRIPLHKQINVSLQQTSEQCLGHRIPMQNWLQKRAVCGVGCDKREEKII